MSIHDIFTLEEEIEILSRTAKIKQDYDKKLTPDCLRHYFSELADEYRLPERIENEMQDYRWKIVKKENLTTNKAIARLFGIKHYTSVTEYIQQRISPEDYNERYSLCREAGEEKGGETNKKSIKRHKLTKEEKQNGGKNGGKTANFKSTGNP
jgi:hypothetical protein